VEDVPSASAPIRVLLVDESPRRSSVLVDALQASGCEVVAVVPCGVDLYQHLKNVEADAIVIDMESPDRDMLEDTRRISSERPRPIVMFVDDGDPEAIRAAIRAGVAGYVVKGADPERVKWVLDVAIARFQELQGLRAELDRARTSLEERKIIDRAKELLMEKRGMSEEDAYKALRRLAMDRNVRLIEVARNVLTMAELL
jgi:response regulator NasT